MLTRDVRPARAGLWHYWKLNSCLSHILHRYINGRLVSDKQLSSCAVRVDLDVGSGYSARLMGWRLVYPLAESQGPNVSSRIIYH